MVPGTPPRRGHDIPLLLPLRIKPASATKVSHEFRAEAKAVDSPAARMYHSGRKGGRNSVVECQLPKLNVVGSNPIARSNADGRTVSQIVA